MYIQTWNFILEKLKTMEEGHKVKHWGGHKVNVNMANNTPPFSLYRLNSFHPKTVVVNYSIIFLFSWQIPKYSLLLKFSIFFSCKTFPTLTHPIHLSQNLITVWLEQLKNKLIPEWCFCFMGHRAPWTNPTISFTISSNPSNSAPVEVIKLTNKPQFFPFFYYLNFV